MRFIILSLLVFFSSLLSAEMYRWVDEKGDVHFSDKPLNEDSKSYTPPPIVTVPAESTGNFIPQPAKKGPVRYKSVSITSPPNDQTFFSDTIDIKVTISISPGLDSASAHKLAFYVNGQLHGEGAELNYTLSNLPRGTYSLSAAVLDARGREIIRSETVSFHVKRHHL